jgi:hypothetical protein
VRLDHHPPLDIRSITDPRLICALGAVSGCLPQASFIAYPVPIDDSFPTVALAGRSACHTGILYTRCEKEVPDSLSKVDN